MTARARFDLKMDAEDKDLVARAAALMGSMMAGFLRVAAKEKALACQPERQDRAAFGCGVPELDDQDATKTILGYYTLSAAQVEAAALSERDRKHLPRYPVPCFRMGRLACHVDRKGQGLGRLLIAGAVQRCLLAREQVTAYALIADAKHAQAKSFYQRYGFRACTHAPMTLYLPLGGL